MTDLFGKNPLNYALDSKDQPAHNAVVTGILGLEPVTRRAVMEQIPLDQLIEKMALDVVPLLKLAGTSVPTA